MTVLDNKLDLTAAERSANRVTQTDGSVTID